MNELMLKIAKLSKIIAKKLGEFTLWFYSWVIGIFIWLPSSFTFYVIDYGFDHKRFLSFKGFREVFRKVVKQLLFPKEEELRKIGYILVLPILKTDADDENPTASMFMKYFNSLTLGKDLELAYEYIDAVHRKNNFFAFTVFIGSAFLYLGVGTTIVEFGDVIMLNGGLGFLSGFVGGAIYIDSANSLGAGLFAIFGFILMMFSAFLLFAVYAVAIITLAVALLCTIWAFKEFKTQRHLGDFIDQSLHLVIESLKKNYENNPKALENIEIARKATIESVQISKVDFLQFEQKLLIKEAQNETAIS